MNGDIAQLGERYNGIVEVTGSIPVISKKSKNEPYSNDGKLMMTS